MKSIDVSAIITNYNGLYLKQSVQSVFDQSVSPKEILIVDNGTTNPEALKILKEFESEARVRIVKLDPNQGPGAARNFGWAQSQGEFIAFLDSGDMWCADKLEYQFEFMQKNTEYALTAHWFDYQPWRVGGRLSRFRVLLTNVVSPCCLMLRRNFPLRFNTQNFYGDDHEFAARAFEFSPIFMIPKVFTKLERPPGTAGGLSASGWRMRKAQLSIYRSMFRDHKLSFLQFAVLTVASFMKHIYKILRGSLIPAQ
jgi:glycosyltransferase involved in cell wall biosynthesis